MFADPPDPAQPGTYSGSAVVDTLARGNYVGMFGLGEICAASGPTGAPNVGSIGTASGIFYRNSRTSIATITDGTSTTIAVGRAEPQPQLRHLDGPQHRRLARQDVARRGGDRHVQPLARGVLDSGPRPGRPGRRPPDAEQPRWPMLKTTGAGTPAG